MQEFGQFTSKKKVLSKPYAPQTASDFDMAAKVQKLGKEVIGWALLVLAILLFPIPVIPTVLVVGGLLALSSRYSWAASLLAKTRKVVPVWISPVNLPMKNAAVSELNV